MYIIGENIHIISQAVKDALRERDREFFMELALKQVEAGAQCIDLNLGPRKKDWEEVFPWIVETVETVVDVPLSIDTTNVFGMEAALKTITKAQPILNSTSAIVSVIGWPPSSTERLAAVSLPIVPPWRPPPPRRTRCRAGWTRRGRIPAPPRRRGRRSASAGARSDGHRDRCGRALADRATLLASDCPAS